MFEIFKMLIYWNYGPNPKWTLIFWSPWNCCHQKSLARDFLQLDRLIRRNLLGLQTIAEMQRRRTNNNFFQVQVKIISLCSKQSFIDLCNAKYSRFRISDCKRSAIINIVMSILCWVLESYMKSDASCCISFKPVNRTSIEALVTCLSNLTVLYYDVHLIQ